MLFLFRNSQEFLPMKKIAFSLFVFCLFSPFGFSKNKIANSLIMVLNNTKNDIDKVNLLNDIANNYKTTDPKLVLQYAEKALQLSQRIRYKLAEGNALLNIGNGNIILGNYSRALQNFADAQQIFEQL